MFDLNECLKEAKKNPKFKQEILQDANQAIEKRYGKKLPYKLTCHSELVFRVKPKICVKSNDDFLDSDLKSVSGGSDPKPQMRISKTKLNRGKDGKLTPTYVYEPGFEPLNQQSSNGGLSSSSLESVSGGSPGPNGSLVPVDLKQLIGEGRTVYDLTGNIMISSAPGSEGYISYRDIIEPGLGPLSLPNRSQLGERHCISFIRGEDGKLHITRHTTLPR